MVCLHKKFKYLTKFWFDVLLSQNIFRQFVRQVFRLLTADQTIHDKNSSLVIQIQRLRILIVLISITVMLVVLRTLILLTAKLNLAMRTIKVWLTLTKTITQMPLRFQLIPPSPALEHLELTAWLMLIMLKATVTDRLV